MATIFDQAIRLTHRQGDVFLGATHPGFANMVGPFGGVTAAVMLNAVMQHEKRLGEPIALTVNYCAGVTDGGFEIHATPVRTNRSTQHWIVQLMQADETVITATLVTALRRQTWGNVEHTIPAVQKPLDYALVDTGRTLPWVKAYAMRPIVGFMPSEWDGVLRANSLSQIWLRDEQQRQIDLPALAALCDIFFPRIFIRRPTRVPIGTVSFTVYFHYTNQEILELCSPASYVLAQAQGQNFRNGFFDQVAQVWCESGELLASTHQTVYYKN